MIRSVVIVVVAAMALVQVTATSALAAAPSPGYRGLALFTQFPNQTVRAGEPVTLGLTLHNYGLPPQLASLSVAQSAPGWKVSFLGAGRGIGAVSVATDQEATFSVRLEPPQQARPATYNFVLVAKGQDAAAQLPLALTFGKVVPARLGLQAELPVLRGTGSSSFKYRVTLRNDSDQDLLANLEAQTPKGFQVTFTIAFGSQQVTSLPIKAGESKDLDVDVTLPQDAAASTYNVTVRAVSGEARAEQKLTLEVTGRPDLSITTPDGRLSGTAIAGRESPVKIVVKNRGGAPARNVEVSSFEPSGWQVKFEPSRIDEIKPKGEAQVNATIKPAPKAIAGDYMLTLRANAGDSSASADFRVTVDITKGLGLVAILVIAVAVGVLGLVVTRYGRR